MVVILKQLIKLGTEFWHSNFIISDFQYCMQFIGFYLYSFILLPVFNEKIESNNIRFENSHIQNLAFNTIIVGMLFKPEFSFLETGFCK